jgi:hypothetical protein
MAALSPRRLHGDEGGQVAAVAVACAAIVACLLLLVVNTGSATAGKVEMQNAADATAVSGATWMARGLNVISMNNVTQTQLLAVHLLLPALNDALTEATSVAQAERVACAALTVGAAACAAFFTAQIASMQTAQRVVVGPANRTLGGRSGLLWQTMLALSQMSVVVKTTFPLMAELESHRIAQQNGADLGVLVPAQVIAGHSLLPSLPAHEGALRADLCHPTRYGSPAPDERGYHQLLGYEINEGPLEWYGGVVEVPTYLYALTGLPLFFRGLRERYFAELCGAELPERPRKQKADLQECRARGGRAVWNYVVFDTVPYADRPGSIGISGDDDRQIAGRPRFSPVQAGCAWTPPGRPVGPNRYRAVQEFAESVARPGGEPGVVYRYRVHEYTLASTLDAEDETDSDLPSQPRRRGEPFPLLLGRVPGAADEDVAGELRYLAVAYRSRAVQAAPAHFLSPLGAHRLTYAQARVYNLTAFDLFTQDWQVTLEPASLVEDGTLMRAFSSRPFGDAVSRSAVPLDQLREAAGALSLDANVLRLVNNH